MLFDQNVKILNYMATCILRRELSHVSHRETAENQAFAEFKYLEKKNNYTVKHK